MMFREVIAVRYSKYTKHINTLCGQHAEFLIVTSGGAYGCQFAGAALP